MILVPKKHSVSTLFFSFELFTISHIAPSFFIGKQVQALYSFPCINITQTSIKSCSCVNRLDKDNRVEQVYLFHG